jgi:hypothetical protein
MVLGARFSKVGVDNSVPQSAPLTSTLTQMSIKVTEALPPTQSRGELPGCPREAKIHPGEHSPSTQVGDILDPHVNMFL